MKPEISLIVSFYNNIDLLRVIFASLKQQTFTDFEVVIADDGSRKEVVDAILQLGSTVPFQVRHCWQEDMGWRKNAILNRAIETSQGEYLIFIDGDCIPHRRFLEEHRMYQQKGMVLTGRRVQLTKAMSARVTVEAFESGQMERWIAFRLILSSLFQKGLHVENAVRIAQPWLRHMLVKDKEKGLLGCNFSVFKADMLVVNGFDERFQHPGTGEDTDLNSRLIRAGIKTRSKKHLLTVYHLYHKRFDLNFQPNIDLWEENNKNGITYTPWGIRKI